MPKLGFTEQQGAVKDVSSIELLNLACSIQVIVISVSESESILEYENISTFIGVKSLFTLKRSNLNSAKRSIIYFKKP